MLNAIIEWSLRHRLVVLAGAAMFVVLGALSLRYLGIDAFPDTTPVQVQINTYAPSLTPEEVERQITFPVEQAINGIEAIEKAQAQTFDLVVVDVNMPKMDGFSFLRALRRGSPSVATLPALVITTESSEYDLDDARTAGASFYLIKPVSEANLLRHAAVLTGRQNERVA